MELSSGARRLSQLLQSYARLSGRAFPFQATLAKKLCCSDRTVRRYASELAKAGRLAIIQRQRHSAEYRLLPVHNVQANVQAGVQAKSAYIGVSSSELRQSQLAMPEPTITNEYGRTEPNPEFEYLSGVLRNALGRIRNARNPLAYERAVIQAELRALRKPAGKEAALFRAAGSGKP